MRSLSRLPVVVAAAALTLLAGCSGASGEGEVRNIGSETDGSGSGSGSASGPGSASASGTATESASASGSGSGSASGTAAAERECSPVNPDLAADADATVDIDLVDYAFEPEDVEVEAGVVTFATSNAGTEAHEFAVLPGGGEVPVTPEGAPDEEALAAAGAFELEAYGPGQDCNATWELQAGDYTLFCIVEAADGETHAQKGMVGTLTVG